MTRRESAAKQTPTLKNESLEVRLLRTIVEIESLSAPGIALEVKRINPDNPHDSVGPKGALFRIQAYIPGEEKAMPSRYECAWLMPDGKVISKTEWYGKQPDLDKYR